MLTRNLAGRRAGLTLIEMMVVLALTLFMMTLFTSLFVQATGGMNNAQGITRIDQSLRTTITVLRKDLSDVVLQGPQTPGGAFISERPTGGYFMIEENSPAIRQGLDQWNMPVEVDVDDVLAFTAQRDGTSAQEMFYGSVIHSSPATDYELFLDNYGSPQSRFDNLNDGVTSSRYAEIVYFLRPSDFQPSADEVRGHLKEDDADSDDPRATTSTLLRPVLYTLYRRQLVVLEDDIANAPELTGTVPVENYYSKFEISAKPDPDNPQYMKFNTIGSLDLRRNRFGLYHDPSLEDNDYPLSWTGPSSNSSETREYFRLNNNATGDRMQWFGRPISLETNLPLQNFFESIATAITNEDADPDENGVIGSSLNATNDFDDADAAWRSDSSVPYRYGEDVLLENVISFDIKVYDDDPRVESNATIAAGSLPTIAVNTTRNSGTVVADQRAPEFIDLGYRGDEGGVWTSANTAYTDTSSDLSYSQNQTTFGFPARWRLPGVALTTSAPAYSPVRTYDTWSDEYEINPDAAVANGTTLRPIPYPKPLRAIQIKIRTLDPKSGVVREVALIHRFSE